MRYSYIGLSSSQNKMVVAGGAGVPSTWQVGGALVVGYADTANANNSLLLIDGAGVPGSAVVTNVSNVVLGRYNAQSSQNNNSLMIANGGQPLAGHEADAAQRHSPDHAGVYRCGCPADTGRCREAAGLHGACITRRPGESGAMFTPAYTRN